MSLEGDEVEIAPFAPVFLAKRLQVAAANQESLQIDLRKIAIRILPNIRCKERNKAVQRKTR
jgi:hypothetical protein